MNLSRKKLLFPFFIGIISTLFMPALFPEMRFFFFSPFIVIALYLLPYLKSLLLIFILWLFLSIFSFDSRLGLIGIILVLNSIILYPLKTYFFADRVYTLPLMTYLFSVGFTLIQGFFFSIFSNAESFLNALLT